MTANEWLGVMKQAQDFPKGMEKLIVKYGEMLIAEHESEVKKLNLPDVSKCNENELTKCENCGDMVKMISSGEFCPHCFC